MDVASGLISILGSTLLLWYGAKLLIGDQLIIDQFVAFNMLIGNRNADYIVVLDKGIVAERGTHDELMAIEISTST